MWNENGVGDFHMSFIRSAPAWLVGAAVSLGGIAYTSVASAADMPVKAKVVPVVGASVPLDVHGYVYLTFATTRVTPGGLLIYKQNGYLTQIDTGVSLDIYKNPTGFINSVSVFGGVWNEFWSAAPPGARAWQEMDWWLGVTVGFAEYWKFTAQNLVFEFPSGGSVENYYFILSYDDSHWGWPVAFNPTVKLFYNANGGSTVVFGKRDDTYRVELGVAPTVAMQKYWGVPLTFGFPTWVTIAPSSYYNRNDFSTARCGTTQTLPCGLDNVGVVSTGIQAKFALDAFVPKRLGSWYVKAGAQYYHIVNDALLAAQVVTGAATSFNNAHRDVVVGTAGVGFSF